MSDLEKALDNVMFGFAANEINISGLSKPTLGHLYTIVDAARRQLNLTSDETKRRAVKSVGKILYEWGDDEPNPATGHLLIVEAEAVVEAVLRSVEEGKT